MTHALKIWPEHFKDINSGLRLFDIRKNDRNFQAGDAVLLQEFEHENKKYTGNEWIGSIDFVFSDDSFGLKKGYVILGLVKESTNN